MDIEFEHQEKFLCFTLSAPKMVDPELKIATRFLAEVFEGFLAQDLKLSLQQDQVLSLSLQIQSEEQIQQINRDFRGKDKPTDVLSFPQFENMRAGDFDFMVPEVELGDIIICHEVCQRQADEFSLEYIEEFYHLAVHGFLHVCGYDHELSESEQALMEGLEQKLLNQLKKKRA